MARLIEIRPAEESTSSLALQVGDLLLFWATGGHVRHDADSVEFLGPFRTGVLANDGRIHSQEGPPNRVAFLARRSGRAEIDVVRGDPWSKTQTTTFDLTVE